MSEDRPAHSPLGASGAARWMNCPGSVSLLKHLGLDESDEPDYRREGLAMHEAAAHCLREGLDAWEIVGQTFYGTLMTPELADPIQVYLDHCCSKPLAARFIEKAISSPVHPQFYGTLDHGGSEVTPGGMRLHVDDLKGGAGIMVEVANNPQLKYYAFGLIDTWERESATELSPTIEVVLSIVQPRGFHTDGPVRSWTTTVGDIKRWVHGELVPAMNATAFDSRLTPGDWCRFCPAKLICPLLSAVFKAAATADPKQIPDISDQMLGLGYHQLAAAKHYIKAYEAETLSRLTHGKDLGDQVKLVRQKANRVWKEGAAALAEAKFGREACYTLPEFKSPAQLEKLPAASGWVNEFAYTPETGFTVALASDARLAVKPTPPTERFSAVREQLQASVDALQPEW